MKPTTRVDMTVALAGHPVRLSLVRDVITNESGKVVVLENGMKIKISQEDSELLQRALTARKNQIANEGRKTGRV